MKLTITLTAIAILTTKAAVAADSAIVQLEDQVSELCGTHQINEMVRSQPGDVYWTKSGFRVESLNEVVPLDDVRLVFTDARSTYLCTQGTGEKESVRWLFIPRKSLF